MNTTEAEEAKAEAKYRKERYQFRAALSAGKRTIALQLVNDFDWPSDMIADELVDWLNQE